MQLHWCLAPHSAPHKKLPRYIQLSVSIQWGYTLQYKTIYLMYCMIKEMFVNKHGIKKKQILYIRLLSKFLIRCMLYTKIMNV